MTSTNSDRLVRRILGISWPRRFMLAVFVVVAVVGAAQIASLPGCSSGAWVHHTVSSKTSGPAQVTITPGPDSRDIDPLAHVVVKADAGTLTEVLTWSTKAANRSRAP